MGRKREKLGFLQTLTLGKPVQRVSMFSLGGYSIERIKKMYPFNWREAAKHFGVTVDE